MTSADRGDVRLEADTTLRAALDLAAGARDDHRVLAEGDAEQVLVETELAQHRPRIGRVHAGALIDRGDGAACAGLHQAQCEWAHAERVDAILGPGRQPLED